MVEAIIFHSLVEDPFVKIVFFLALAKVRLVELKSTRSAFADAQEAEEAQQMVRGALDKFARGASRPAGSPCRRRPA